MIELAHSRAYCTYILTSTYSFVYLFIFWKALRVLMFCCVFRLWLAFYLLSMYFVLCLCYNVARLDEFRLPTGPLKCGNFDNHFRAPVPVLGEEEGRMSYALEYLLCFGFC